MLIDFKKNFNEVDNIRQKQLAKSPTFRDSSMFLCTITIEICDKKDAHFMSNLNKKFNENITYYKMNS